MSEVLKKLKELPEAAQRKIKLIYGDPDKLYETVYLIAKNEHVLQEEKPEQWEAKIKVVNAYQAMIRSMLDEFGLDGKEVIADITSDYLEDYVNYREQDFGMTNEEFISIIKRIGGE